MRFRLLALFAPPAAGPVVWLEPTEVIQSPQTGIWWPVVEKGHTVAAGALLGTITDFFGKRIAEVEAPFAGEMLYVVRTPPTSAGEPLAMIGRSAEKPPALPR